MRVETTMITATITGCAFLFTIFMHLRTQHAMRRSACLEIYKLWSASLLTEARHRAWRKMDQMAEHSYLMREFSEDGDFLYDFSMIEHFLVDLHRLIREGMICPKLARTLFADSARRWLDRMESTVYAERRPYSYHYGRTAEEARLEFRTQILPLRGILGIENGGGHRAEPMRASAH